MVPLARWECFFFKKTADVLATHLSVVFLLLVRLRSLPASWRRVNATAISNGPPSSFAANYRLISITSILSRMFERRESVRL